MDFKSFVSVQDNLQISITYMPYFKIPSYDHNTSDIRRSLYKNIFSFMGIVLLNFNACYWG